MSTPATRTVAFVTLAMAGMGALGVYGWLQIQHADTGGFLYVFAALANTLGLVWNNVTTARVRDKTEHIENQVADIASVTTADPPAAPDPRPRGPGGVPDPER